MFPLTREARALADISRSSTGALKKKELLDILLIYEEISENEGFMKYMKKEEAKSASVLIDKTCLAYFRALDGPEARSLVLELAMLVDRVYARMIVSKYG